jgi:osmotically inducible protein OsmC
MIKRSFMMQTLYMAHAKAIGGRNGHAQTDDGHLNVELATPGASPQKHGNVTNPEQLFAAGYAACFGSAVEHVARLQNIALHQVEVHADVGLNQDDQGFFISVALNVVLSDVDVAVAHQLIRAAHQVCPYSKATRGNITVLLKSDGQTLV